jgi:hypothetical protein
MFQPARERIGYERALRVLGRHLDAWAAYHVSVLEIGDGFTIRSQPVRHRTDDRIEHFTWSALRHIDVLHTAARYVEPRRSRHRGLWTNLPTGHQDFFRALGHLLDCESAAQVRIDELPDGLSVSYLKPAPHHPPSWQKCHQLYRREDIETLLGEAQRRRGQSVANAS